MEMIYWVAGIMAVGVFVYLVIAMVKPEIF